MVGIGLVIGASQIGFNWSIFMRAVNDTKPLATYRLLRAGGLRHRGVPGMLLWGIDGYAVAVCAITAVQLAIRTYYLKRLFAGFGMVRHSGPSDPAVPAGRGRRFGAAAG